MNMTNLKYLFMFLKRKYLLYIYIYFWLINLKWCYIFCNNDIKFWDDNEVSPLMGQSEVLTRPADLNTFSAQTNFKCFHSVRDELNFINWSVFISRDVSFFSIVSISHWNPDNMRPVVVLLDISRTRSDGPDGGGASRFSVGSQTWRTLRDDRTRVEEDKCTLRVFHIEFLECVSSWWRRKKAWKVLRTGRASHVFSSPDAPDSTQKTTTLRV